MVHSSICYLVMPACRRQTVVLLHRRRRRRLSDRCLPRIPPFATLVRPIQLISPQLRESACECSPITSHLDHLSTRANGFKFTISTSFIFFLNFMIDHITCSPTKR
ncbi:hypothetical protein BLOT_012682, partial [Blomia tropicalis]